MSSKSFGEVVRLPLGHESDFELYIATMEEDNKISVIDMNIRYQNHLLAENYLAVIEFFAVLDAFVKKGLLPGDDSRFFTYAQKIDKHKNIIRSLRCKFDPQRYLSYTTIKVMHQIYLECKVGLSFSRTLMNNSVITVDGIKVEPNGFAPLKRTELVGAVKEVFTFYGTEKKKS